MTVMTPDFAVAICFAPPSPPHLVLPKGTSLCGRTMSHAPLSFAAASPRRTNAVQGTECAVIGAGLAGSLLALMLARRGHAVTLYEGKYAQRDISREKNAVSRENPRAGACARADRGAMSRFPPPSPPLPLPPPQVGRISGTIRSTRASRSTWRSLRAGGLRCEPSGSRRRCWRRASPCMRGRCTARTGRSGRKRMGMRGKRTFLSLVAS